jgi:hypothetical protein
MRFDPNRQWVGAVYAEDLFLMREMLSEDPSFADSAHTEFDDPYRRDRYPVPTLLFEGCPLLLHETPLHLAAAFGTLSLIDLLLDHDCDPSLKNNRGEIPRDVAVRRRRPERIIDLFT